jgi:hypothetical protein
VLQKMRKFVLAVASISWVAAMVTNAAFDNVFIGYPRIPDSAASRTVPYEVKRVVVYVTERQSDALYVLEWLQIISGSLIVISLFLAQWWPMRPADTRRELW